MECTLENLEKILRIYLGRGKQILEALSSQQVEEALELMTWRKAAFHNFKVMDHQMVLRSPHYHAEEPFLDLIAQVNDVNQQLEGYMSDFNLGLGSQLSALRYAKGKLNKFKSLNESSKRFQMEV